MKATKYILLLFLLGIAIFLCFRYSKEGRQRRQIDTYNKRIKEYRKNDSLNKVLRVGKDTISNN
jgi:hypothetical protein